MSGQKKKVSYRQWAKTAMEKIKGARTALAINRDVLGLVKQGSDSAQMMHDAAMLSAEARIKLTIAETEFDIWMAGQRRNLRQELGKEREGQKFVYRQAPPRQKRGMAKPADLKDSEIKDAILVDPEYRRRRQEIATLTLVLETAEKAFFKPADVRSMMIMSIGKIVNREPV